MNEITEKQSRPVYLMKVPFSVIIDRRRTLLSLLQELQFTDSGLQPCTEIQYDFNCLSFSRHSSTSYSKIVRYVLKFLFSLGLGNTVSKDRLEVHRRILVAYYLTAETLHIEAESVIGPSNAAGVLAKERRYQCTSNLDMKLWKCCTLIWVVNSTW